MFTEYLLNEEQKLSACSYEFSQLTVCSIDTNHPGYYESFYETFK